MSSSKPLKTVFATDKVGRNYSFSPEQWLDKTKDYNFAGWKSWRETEVFEPQCECSPSRECFCYEQ